MSKEKKILPELRFPEFKNEGEWKKDKVDNLFYLQDGYPFSSFDFTKDQKNSKQVIRITDINNLNKNSEKVYVSTNKIRELDIEKYKIQQGDLLLSLTGAAGFNFFIWNTEDAYINQRTMKIYPKNAENKALTMLLEPLIHAEINALGSGQNNNLSKDELKEIKVTFPKSKEQNKIASCLSFLNEVITVQIQKMEILKDHKMGLIQNLFPQEGEKVPKYRFPEFRKDVDWVFESFDKVYSFLVTNSFSRELLNYENGKVKNIHYGDIHTKFSTLFDITKEKVPYINSDVPIERIRQECYCKEGDMIFADASEDLDDVGKSIEIIKTNNENLLSGLHTLLARQIEPKLITGFGGYLFLSDKIREQIKREAQGAKVLGISGTRISKINIYYPKNQKEQKKIVECLSSLDALIKTQDEKIDQLKLHKKGLMQSLFPKTIG